MKNLVFVLGRQNKNSIKALCAALEVSDFPEDLVKFVRDPWDLEGIPGDRLVLFSFTTPYFLQRSGFLKEFLSRRRKGDLFIAGGPHPSGDPLGTLDFGFDGVFVGEGEEGIVDMAKGFLEGELPGIKGLVLKGGRVSKAPRVDINRFPSISPRFKRLGALEITRGCKSACKFCQTSYLFGRDPRHRSLDMVLSEVETLFSCGIRDIRFISPDAFSYPWIEGLLKGARGIVGKRGKIFFGSFPSEVRPDSVKKEVVELVKAYCDNKRIGIGAQTGSDRLLKLIGRGHTREDVIRAVNLLKGFGFEVYVDFIFGLPYETEEDEKETISLINFLAGRGVRIHGHTFMPLPGTPFSRKKPGTLSKRIKEVMGKLSREGIAFGSWDYQERIFS